MKKPKSIEEPEKPVKKKNRKRWRKKKDLSSNSSSSDPILTRPLRWNKKKHIHPRMNDLEPDKKVSFLFLAFIYHISLVAFHYQ